MKITKDKNTAVVELTKAELSGYNVKFEDLELSSIHTRAVIRDIISSALKEDLKSQREVTLLPDGNDGCVLVCKRKREKFTFTWTLVE